jgi:hypothetical protein
MPTRIRSICFRFAIAAWATALVSLWPLAAGAQPLDPSSSTLTPEQVRAAFIRAGYDVEEPVTFDWTSPPVTSFRVHDSRFNRRATEERWGIGASDRVLLVLVYSDVATARTEEAKALARQDMDERRDIALGDGAGPRLVPGYGPSMWQQNVALVQSYELELSRLYAAEAEMEQGGVASPLVAPPAPSYTVDGDFIAAVVNAGRVDL